MNGPWEKYQDSNVAVAPDGPWTKYASVPQVPLQNITAQEPRLFGPVPESFFKEHPSTGDQSGFVDKVAGAVEDPLGFVEDAPGIRFVPVVTPGLELLSRALPEGKIKQGVTGAEQGVGDVAENITSPGSLSMIASGGGLEAALPKLTKLGFSVWMGYEGVKGARQS